MVNLDVKQPRHFSHHNLFFYTVTGENFMSIYHSVLEIKQISFIGNLDKNSQNGKTYSLVFANFEDWTGKQLGCVP